MAQFETTLAAPAQPRIGESLYSRLKQLAQGLCLRYKASFAAFEAENAAILDDQEARAW